MRFTIGGKAKDNPNRKTKVKNYVPLGDPPPRKSSTDADNSVDSDASDSSDETEREQFFSRENLLALLIALSLCGIIFSIHLWMGTLDKYPPFPPPLAPLNRGELSQNGKGE
eukprot:Selendium_serpulae@DN3203_c1_g1_i1.p1